MREIPQHIRAHGRMHDFGMELNAIKAPRLIRRRGQRRAD